MSVSGVSVDDEVVTLELGSELEAGQTVTVDYVHDADTPLRRAGGGDPAPGFVGQAVDMSSLSLPGQPENLELSSTPGDLSLLATWDEVEGATSYKLRWRESGGEFETANTSTRVSGGAAVVTVSDYGEWEVRVRACNDAGCGPEASAMADVVKAASLSLERSGSRTIAATWEAVPNAASYNLNWERLGADQPANIQAQAQSTAVRQVRSAANSPALDRPASLSSGQRENAQTNYQLTFGSDQTRAEFTVPDDGAYRVDLEAVDGGNELIAMASSQVGQAPGRPDTTPPWLVWGEIDGNRMRLYFSEPLDEEVVMARFFIMVQFADCCWSGGARDKRIEVRGNVVTVDLGSTRAIEGFWASTYYIAKTGDRIGLRDLAGNTVRTTQFMRLDNVTGQPYVTGISVSSDPGDDGSYASGDTIKVKVMFRKDVDVTGAPRLKIDLDPADGGEKWAYYSGGSGTRNLEFAYTVAAADISTAGVAVIEDTLELNGGAIRGAPPGPADNARLAHVSLDHNPFHRVVTPDSAAPILKSASVTGTTLTLTFSETLGAAALLATSTFTVKKTPQGGTEETVSLGGSPAISGATVTLTLENAVLDTDEWVKVSYAKPSSGMNNKLVDASGTEAADFTDERVMNTLDTTPPRLVRGEIDGDVMTIYFSEPLDETSVGGSFRVTLQWTDRFGSRWDYGQCSPFRHQSFTAKPREVYVRGNTIVVVGLDESTGIRAGVGRMFINFIYRRHNDPAVKVLRDLVGNAVSTPVYRGESSEVHSSTRIITLDNVTRLPYPKSATVVGDRLTMIFSAPMDGDSKPASSAFTVKVNGSAVSLAGANPVSVSSRVVTLTLATAVASGDTVTVSYAKPSARPLQNVICEDAPDFTDVSVSNSTQ